MDLDVGKCALTIWALGFLFYDFIFAKFNPLNPVWLPRKCSKTKRVGRCELFAFFIIYFLKDIFLNYFLINQMGNLFIIYISFFLILINFFGFGF